VDGKHARDWPGIGAFLQVDGVLYHTYSTFGLGIEEFHNGYPYLDLTAFGRQEDWEEPAGRATPLGSTHVALSGLRWRLAMPRSTPMRSSQLSQS
jgi:predicted dithiol-disulfide oxidoreductase (DUF899 family)